MSITTTRTIRPLIPQLSTDYGIAQRLISSYSKVVLVMRKHLLIYLIAAAVSPATLYAQSPAASVPAKPTEHFVGTVTTIDPSFKSLAVKEDKTGTEYSVSLENTKTFLKIAPGSNDLKTASRFNPSDLNTGDRVSIRGYKMDGIANGVAAASVLLMSARDLQVARQTEMEAWQHSTAGVVNAVDTATKQLKVTVRTAAGPKVVAVDGTNARFTRYTPSSLKGPAASQLSEIQPGDQVRVIGASNQDGSIITAQKVYSGTFRTVAGTVASISPDGKEITINNRQTKQPVQFAVTSESAIRKLPPQMAMSLAHPSAPAVSNDLSQQLERVPKISITDLKQGDAVIATGGTGAGSSSFTATNIIAGVEPLLQSPSRRGGHSSAMGNDWSLDLAIPVE